VPDGLRTWLFPAPAAGAVITEPARRRLAGTEVLVVLTVTLGLSALRSALSLLDALLQPVPLDQQQVALNAPGARADLVDLAVQLARVLQLVGWGALGAYLLIRAGFALRAVGLDGARPVRDALGAALPAAGVGCGFARTMGGGGSTVPPTTGPLPVSKPEPLFGPTTTPLGTSASCSMLPMTTCSLTRTSLVSLLAIWSPW
jgi:hypothetical protein